MNEKLIRPTDAADGSIVQLVILDAIAAGLIPFRSEQY